LTDRLRAGTIEALRRKQAQPPLFEVSMSFARRRDLPRPFPTSVVVVVTCTDPSGNAATGSATVTVPHDRRN
jgi:hypothetical protein